MQERTTENPVRRIYPRAPVTEAVLEIRFQPRIPLEATRLDGLAAESGYPDRSEINAFEGKIEFGPEVSATTRSTHAGYLYKSPDGHGSIIARTDLFAVSRTAPYERWEELRADAMRVWPVFRALVEPVSFPRIGLRYINKLVLPLPMDDLADFLRTVPTVSPDLPQELMGFLLQVRIPNETLGTLLTLNQAMLPFEEPNEVPVLLDIDVAVTPDRDLDETELWQLVDTLHAEENRTFEACITDRTRRLIS